MPKVFACARAARLVCIIVAACFFTAAVAHADDDDKGRVVVTVRANDGTPVVGAIVTLTSSQYSKSEKGDDHGVAKFKHVVEGTYALHAVAPGYQAISQRTVTIGTEREELTIVMSPATTNSLTVIGQVRASAGETVSTASAPTRLAQRAVCRCGRRPVGRADALEPALDDAGDSAGRRKQCDDKLRRARSRSNRNARRHRRSSNE